MNDNKPFNKYYVLRITSLHIKKAIDTSIRKTYERLKDVTSKVEVFDESELVVPPILLKPLIGLSLIHISEPTRPY